MASQELVSHDNNFAKQIHEFVCSNEALADLVTRRDYFERMDSDGFLDLTQQIASLARTGDSTVNQNFDGNKVTLMTHEVPDHADKEALLRQTWATAKCFLTDRNIADEDALEYAALTVAGGVLYTHPFADGNGRTSRYLSYVVAEGGRDLSVLEEIGESLSKEWQVTPSSKIVSWEYPTYQNEQPLSIGWEFQFLDDANDALDGAIASSIFKNDIVREFIDKADDETLKLIESSVTRDEQGAMLSLNGDKLLEILANDETNGIGNAKHLLDIKRQLQAEYVLQYLEAMRSNNYGHVRVFKEADFVQPEAPGSDSPGARKLYESRKARYEIITKILGERAVGDLVLVRDEAVAHHRAFSEFHRRNFRQSVS